MLLPLLLRLLSLLLLLPLLFLLLPLLLFLLLQFCCCYCLICCCCAIGMQLLGVLPRWRTTHYGACRLTGVFCFFFPPVPMLSKAALRVQTECRPEAVVMSLQ